MENNDSIRTCWKITLELRSPLQIGAGTLGFVEKTELFIPPRVIWGALTAAITGILGGYKKGDFIKIGNVLGNSSLSDFYSTFFPSDDCGKTFWVPCYINGERFWYCYSDWEKIIDPVNKRTDTQMREKFITGITGQATDPVRMATQKNMLHETDIIKATIRKKSDDNEMQWSLIPVCFVGYARLPNKITLNSGVAEQIVLNKDKIRDVFTRIRLGGGRKRGRGIVVCRDVVESIVGTHTFPMMKVCERNVICSPGHLVSTNDTNADGRAVLETFRVYDNKNDKGSGRNFSNGELCWEVGTMLS